MQRRVETPDTSSLRPSFSLPPPVVKHKLHKETNSSKDDDVDVQASVKRKGGGRKGKKNMHSMLPAPLFDAKPPH